MWHTPRFPGRILFSPRDRGPTGPRRSSHQRRSADFWLELLEERTVLSTLMVTNPDDSIAQGLLSLRQAIVKADSESGDVIKFDSSKLKGKTITLRSGELMVSSSMTIDGGTNNVTISGNDASRVFDIIDINPSNPQTKVTIAGLTITHGLADKNAPDYKGTGGGILNQGDLTLNNVVVSYNKAVGDATESTAYYKVTSAGAGSGGGVDNLGTLKVTHSTFDHNQALGGDKSEASFPNLPGLGFGGGLFNLTTAIISDSRFTENLAQGGSNCTGSFAGMGQGGGIYNDFNLTVTGSVFCHNQAVGGNGNTGDINVSRGLGGGIGSGSITPISQRSAVLTVSESMFSDNEANGGDGNSLTSSPPSQALGCGDGFGGGIYVYEGDATICRSTLYHNQAVGGAGNQVGGAEIGSFGFGGGLGFLDFIGNNLIPDNVIGVTAQVEGCTLVGNVAKGGDAAGNVPGGDAMGGGLAAGSLGGWLLSAPKPGSVTVTNTLVANNLAQGGDGVGGGNGYGGGVFNDAGSDMTASESLIILNVAQGGNDGEGNGGGVYHLGTFTFDSTTVIKKNHASTSNNDIGP